MWGGDGVGERVGMGVEVMVWGSAVGRGSQVEKLFFGFIKIFFFLYACVCMCTTRMLLPMEARREHQIYWL